GHSEAPLSSYGIAKLSPRIPGSAHKGQEELSVDRAEHGPEAHDQGDECLQPAGFRLAVLVEHGLPRDEPSQWIGEGHEKVADAIENEMRMPSELGRHADTPMEERQA